MILAYHQRIYVSVLQVFALFDDRQCPVTEKPLYASSYHAILNSSSSSRTVPRCLTRGVESSLPWGWLCLEFLSARWKFLPPSGGRVHSHESARSIPGHRNAGTACACRSYLAICNAAHGAIPCTTVTPEVSDLTDFIRDCLKSQPGKHP